MSKLTRDVPIRARRRALALTALALVAAVALPATTFAAKSPTTSTYVMKRLSSPPRTQVLSSTGKWLATFTDGARSVTVSGPSRSFGEANTTSVVTTTTWVRLLSSPFSGTVDTTWLTNALADRSPDILAIAMQYIQGAPSIYAGSLRIAGDADYGPLQADGTRAAGSDFNDYLGISWTYPAMTDAPEASQYGSLDCSGFVRMVFGYRSGLPLTYSPDGGKSLPRHSYEQASSAPGIVVIPNTGVRPTSWSTLQPGDLVFFDATADAANEIDHAAIYLGKDSNGHSRFISSRKTINGPTMGDTAGASILDGTGLYATSFRTARRI